MKDLTIIQRNVLEFTKRLLKQGLPFPSLKLIADHFGFSRNTARSHLLALEKKGQISKRAQKGEYQLEGETMQNQVTFDLSATIPAGVPVPAYEVPAESISFDQYFFGGGELKAVRVSGESMIGDAISHGDIAMIKFQHHATEKDIVAVRVNGDEITLKRIKQRHDMVDLIPSNPDFSVRSVPAETVEIIGKLVGIVRRT